MELMPIIQQKIEILEKYVNINCANQGNYSDLKSLIDTIKSQMSDYNSTFSTLDGNLKYIIITAVKERFDLVEQLNDKECNLIDELFEVLLDLPTTLHNLTNHLT